MIRQLFWRGHRALGQCRFAVPPHRSPGRRNGQERHPCGSLPRSKPAGPALQHGESVRCLRRKGPPGGGEHGAPARCDQTGPQTPMSVRFGRRSSDPPGRRGDRLPARWPTGRFLTTFQRVTSAFSAGFPPNRMQPEDRMIAVRTVSVVPASQLSHCCMSRLARPSAIKVLLSQ